MTCAASFGALGCGDVCLVCCLVCLVCCLAAVFGWCASVSDVLVSDDVCVSDDVLVSVALSREVCAFLALSASVLVGFVGVWLARGRGKRDMSGSEEEEVTLGDDDTLDCVLFESVLFATLFCFGPVALVIRPFVS